MSYAIGHSELMHHLFMTIQQKSSLVSAIMEFWHWKNDGQIRRLVNAHRFPVCGTVESRTWTYEALREAHPERLSPLALLKAWVACN